MPMGTRSDDSVGAPFTYTTADVSGGESLTHPDGTEIDFDHDNDSTTNTDPDALFSRGDFARHLYIVTLLTTTQSTRLKGILR